MRKKIIGIALAGMLALAPTVALTGCEGWQTITSGGIDIENAERDADGYITEEEAKKGALNKAEILDEAFVDLIEAELDKSGDPVKWVVDFDSEGTSYHYEVNAENGDLIDFSSGSFGLDF